MAAPGRDDVVAALHRIAFLLERSQASEYRAAAYRRAGDRLRDLPDGEWRARRADGAWTTVPDVGSSTARVVSDVLAGRTPDVATELEAALAERLAGATQPGRVLRASLRGDLHAHTDASDGATPIQDMALAALAIGHEYLAITDHSPRLTVANGLSAARLRAQMDRIALMNQVLDTGDRPLRLLTGIEVDILGDGTLDQKPGLLRELDVVVASVHSRLRSERSVMTRRMVTAVSDPATDVLGHCTGRRVRGRTRPPSDFDAAEVFAACAAHGVAVEVNARPDRRDPPDELLAVALDAGCLFTVDSDAHAPGQLDWLVDGCDRLAAFGVDQDRVVTTWRVDRLLEWTHRHD